MTSYYEKECYSNSPEEESESYYFATHISPNNQNLNLNNNNNNSNLTSDQSKPLQTDEVLFFEQTEFSDTISATESTCSSLSELKWVSRFQSILSKPNFDPDELLDLTQEFEKTAKNYGRVILLEKSLPVAQKTIKPSDIGGIAGGEKFIAGGILFKFAKDTELRPNRFLYGGDGGPSEERAIKAAGHELKGLEGIFSLRSCLSVPLMALIDYRGYRLIALSLLPISSTTLVYGSNNAGVTISDGSDHPPVVQALKELGAKFNLREHHIKSSPKAHSLVTLYTGADVEIHCDPYVQGQYYCLDFARLYPPTWRNPNEPFSNIFTNLFRSEFLQTYHKRLSSDSLSGFSKYDPLKEEHKEDIKEATKYLLTTVVNDLIENTLTIQHLGNYTKAVFHAYGLNLRYLGHVRNIALKCAKETENPDILLSNCNVLLQYAIARSIKSYMNGRMRLLQTSGQNDYQLKKELASVLNTLVSTHQGAWTKSSSWLKKTLIRKYADCLQPDEMEVDISGKIEFVNLFFSLNHISTLTISQTYISELTDLYSNFKISSGLPPDVGQFSMNDIRLKSRVRTMQIIRNFATNLRLEQIQMTKSVSIQHNFVRQLLSDLRHKALLLPKNFSIQKQLIKILGVFVKTWKRYETTLSSAHEIEASISEASQILQQVMLNLRKVDLFWDADIQEILIEAVVALYCSSSPLLHHMNIKFANVIVDLLLQKKMATDRISKLLHLVCGNFWNSEYLPVILRLSACADFQPLICQILSSAHWKPNAEENMSKRWLPWVWSHQNITRLEDLMIYFSALAVEIPCTPSSLRFPLPAFTNLTHLEGHFTEYPPNDVLCAIGKTCPKLKIFFIHTQWVYTNRVRSNLTLDNYSCFKNLEKFSYRGAHIECKTKEKKTFQIYF